MAGASPRNVRTLRSGEGRLQPPLRTPCRPSRPFGAPSSGSARRRPPPFRRRCRTGRWLGRVRSAGYSSSMRSVSGWMPPSGHSRRLPRHRVSAARNRPLVRISTWPNRPSAAGADGGRCGRTTPPPTILMTWSSITPLVGASARTRWRASEPSSMDTYGRERPHQRRAGGGTPGGTPGVPHTPLNRTAPAARKGGSLPSPPSPLARFGADGL